MLVRIILLFLILTSSVGAQDALDRLRSLGKAHYEEDRFEEAVQALENSVQLSQDTAPDRVNLGIAYIAQKRYDEAIEQFELARTLDPNLPHIDYNLGIIAKRRGKFEKSVAHLVAMAELDPADPDARYNLGLVYLRLRKQDEAVAQFQTCVELDPEHASAYYHLMRDALKRGERERADKLLKLYEHLRENPGGEQRTVTALESSVYTALMDIRRPVSPPKENSPIRFTDKTKVLLGSCAVAGQSPVWLDLERDGDMDLWTGTQLYLHNPDGLIDITETAGVPVSTVSIAGDLNNDGLTDLWTQDGRTYQSNGDGSFADLTSLAAIPDYRDPVRLLLDYDHEGDLDMIVADAEGAHLYRNNRDGTYVETTEEAGIDSVAEPGSQLYFSDPDGDNDIDFYLARPGKPVELYRNRRGGMFHRVVLPFTSTGHLAIGDYDSDGDFDLFVVHDGLHLYHNDGKGHFESTRHLDIPAAGVNELHTVDFDNDGFLDLLALWSDGMTLLQGPEFADVTNSVGIQGTFVSASPADADLDGDWDLLLVNTDGKLVYYENQGSQNHWVRVTLEGIKNNFQGWMSKVDVKIGGFSLRREVTSEQTLIGVGSGASIDVLRLLWPNGVAQNLIDVVPDQTIHLEEKQGMPSSCPLLFTWNGERFEYVTDLVDAGALGVPLGPGEYLKPDSDEFVKIRGDQLQPQDGFYEMRITAELHEVIYLDSVELWVIDHPQGTDLYPNEAFGDRLPTSRPIQIVHDAMPPQRAWDQNGVDLLPLVRQFDGTYPTPFDLLPRYQGLATDHTLIFRIPPAQDRTVLWLTGWIDWTDGSSNLAASQHSGLRVLEPQVEVRRDGSWHLVASPMGIPAGHNKSVPVELPAHDGEVRISTNLRLYWDQVAISHEITERALPDAQLHPLGADLHHRGFSEIQRDSLTSPNLFNYDKVNQGSPFVPFHGTFTRYGEVTDLLQEPDDRYVIMSPGDEISLRFLTVAPPREGHVRDYFLYTHGWLKDGDLNTAFGATVEPLPFHAMSNYPYPAGEAYPDDTEHMAYRQQYNTRREDAQP